MNDFEYLSGDSNRTRIQPRLSFLVLLKDIHDKKDRRNHPKIYVNMGLLSEIKVLHKGK